MNRFNIARFAVLTLIGFCACLPARGQSSTDPNEGMRLTYDSTYEIYDLLWWGRAGRTYFVQHSDDLVSWEYLPFIDSGGEDVLAWSFQPDPIETEMFFLRIRYSDIPTDDPFSADFDGDKVKNIHELYNGTDPLLFADTDGDGMPDDWEVAHGLNSLSNTDAGLDTDEDGILNASEYQIGTSPTDSDTDGDNLSDGQEIQVYGTNPLESDTDGDAMPDGWEVTHSLNPLQNDSTVDPDNDDLSNWREYVYSTDPQEADTDEDGLSDGDEVDFYGTNPIRNDSDEDGLSDGNEVILGTDPTLSDSDGDGLTDGDEVLQYLTNPLLVDTDLDTMPDGWELKYQLNPLLADGAADADNDNLNNANEFAWQTHPRNQDTDSDTLRDGDEVYIYLTNPKQYDTDKDSLNDGWEVRNGFSPLVHNLQDANPANDPNADPDGDGLSNSVEEENDTDPNDSDTDDDEVSDGIEVGQGSNPNDPNSSQPPPGGTVPVIVTFGDHSFSHSEKYRVKLTPLEGDDGGVRYRTNRSYGETQQDTFLLPKGSKYTVTLIHIDTDPDYDGEPNPDYDYTLIFEGGGTDASVAVFTDDPEEMLGVHSEHEENSFFAQGKQATLYVATLVSTTRATLPLDRKRKVVGVGERVDIIMRPTFPTEIFWSISGPGEIAITDTGALFRAHDRQSTATITGEVLGNSCSITFDIVEPTGIVMARKDGCGVFHVQGSPSAGFAGEVFVAPFNVSFVWVEVREQSAPIQSDGYWSFLTFEHELGEWIGIDEGNNQMPSEADQFDKIWAQGYPESERQITSGFAEWDIPWEFRVLGGPEKPFTSVLQRVTTNEAGVTTISKGGVTVSAALDDPDDDGCLGIIE